MLFLSIPLLNYQPLKNCQLKKLKKVNMGVMIIKHKIFGGLAKLYYFCSHETSSDISPVHLDHQ